MRKRSIFLFGVLLASRAFAANEISKDDAYKVTSDFSNCGAYYEILAEKNSTTPNTAKDIMSLSYGAQMAAIIVSDSTTSHEKSTTMVLSMVDSDKTHWRAVWEQQDAEALKEQQKKCVGLGKLQDQLVNDWRKQQYGFVEK